MRRLIVTAVAAALTLPVSAAAGPAALLSQIQGDVLVDVGEGFVPAFENVPLELGDRVMLTKEGKAVLSYGGNCSFPLQAPSMTIIEQTACATATQDGQGDGGTLLGLAGLSVAGNFALAGVALAQEEETPVSP